jgi:hypothetical protein
VKNVKNAVIILAITAGCLGGVEGVGRLAIRFIELKRPTGVFGEKILSHQEPMLGFGLKKGITQDMGGWQVRTNLLGFRDSEVSFEKPKDEFRIVLVGGSTVFGWGVNESETIPAFLQKKVSAHSEKNIRVINAGVPWYASWHEAALIFFKIMEMQPDWIISVDALNDTAQGTAPTWEPVSHGYLDPPTKLAFQKLHSDVSQRSFVSDLLSVSQTYTYFSAKLKSREALARGVYHPELWDQYVRLKEQINTMAQAKGIRFTTFFQPVIVEGKKLTPLEMRNNETNMRIPEFAEVFRKTYLEGESRALGDSNIRVISLKNAFKNMEETIYLDGQHYNAQGNQILADEICQQEILPNLKSLISESSPRS